MYLPLHPDSKVPAEKGWRGRVWTLEDLANWKGNIGLKTDEIVIADFDELDPAREFWRKHKELIGCAQRTRRGVHFLFSGSVSGYKFEFGDIKGIGGFGVWEPSVVAGHRYQVVSGSLSELKPFPQELFPPIAGTREVTRDQVRKLDVYLSKVESIQGKGGSHGLKRAAHICKDSGLSEAETVIRLLEWNRSSVVSPPWPEREIARAVTRVYRKG